MLKIAYIGNCGFHSAVVNDATRGDARFTACAVAGGTLDEDMSAYYEEIKEDHPKAVLYSDYMQMLDVEKPDVVVVSPRFDLTSAICMECAGRGIHIFAEKPVATDLDELHQLKEAIKKSGVYFMAMHYLRLEGPFNQAISIVRNGLIGDVRMINAQKSYKLGQRADFFKKRETYGGTIPWVGIHAIDWIYAIAHSPCKKITACQSKVHNNNHGDLESTCLCQFEFDGGVLASLNIDYLRPAKAPSHSDDRLRVVGTEGTLMVENNVLTVINKDGVSTPNIETESNLAIDFLESVLENRECVISQDEIFDITALALLARESADTGKTILL